MLDFLQIVEKPRKNGVDIVPTFVVGKKSRDLMIRGNDFYAVWNAETGLWSEDESDAIEMIDKELVKYVMDNYPDKKGLSIKYMWDSDSGSIDRFHKYCNYQCRDNFKPLNEKLIFSDQTTKKTDYASKRLSYPLQEGNHESYDELMSTLYSPEERHKLEWAIGSIVNGASKEIQKFMVLYGSAGTGKSTVLNIINMLFDGYCNTFESKKLGDSKEGFPLAAFACNPLVSIEQDGDLSKIADNTRINSLVAHEAMNVNEKYKAMYTMTFKTFLFIGTNKPVKITDARAGLLRRLIDVSPTGNLIPVKKYNALVARIPFELSGIAYHCKEVYESNPNCYNDYVPFHMFSATNDMFNFVEEHYDEWSEADGVSLQKAWDAYKFYCDDAKVVYVLNKREFKEELSNYFESIEDRCLLPNGERPRNYFKGFKTEKFGYSPKSKIELYSGLDFKEQESLFDKECCDFAAQYANEKETPAKKWEKVTTKLVDLDTSKLHYVMVPLNHIVIDFDLKDGKGNKSFKKNLEAANKWPKTYAELSKGGRGIHLHYIYDGDPEKLARIYEDDIEIKVFTGNSSLRRRLSKCVNNKIAHINSGLPLKREEKKKVVNFDGVKSEKKLRSMIIKALKKEYENIPPYTRPNIDFINKILSDAYDSGMKYDVTDLRPAVLDFASKSTHQANECIKIVNKMKFASEEPSNLEDKSDEPLVFYDCEVFPNLFVVCWKFDGAPNVVRMINPTSSEIEELVKHKLVGFNSKRYDSHILYGRMMGYNNEQLYKLSQRLIGNKDSDNRNACFGEAYNLGYTDIYDFSSKKQSLKKFEIELGLHHQECPLRWDEPVPEDKWDMVADYCCNDVIATEAVFHARKGDFLARQILADLAGSTVNESTNSLTSKIIFGNEKHPRLIYTDLATGEQY